jgi:hypothetical protein
MMVSCFSIKMCISLSVVDKSRSAVTVLRRIGRELRRTNELSSRVAVGVRTADNSVWRYCMAKAREHDLTQCKHMLADGDVEQLAGLYAEYLSSTHKLQVRCYLCAPPTSLETNI